MRAASIKIFPSVILCLTTPKVFFGEPFIVPFISGIKKIFVSEGYLTVFRRIFGLSVTKTFKRVTTLCNVPKKLQYRKSTRIRGGYQDIPSGNFCLTLAKKP